MITHTLQPETQASRMGRFLKWLRPLDVASQEIRALDGVRAIAALQVVAFHTFQAAALSLVVAGASLNFLWSYLQTGVQLFFVLSGFLLFMPYVRAMLTGKAWPSLRTFYQRRALRILPAYYACLAILVAVRGAQLFATEGKRFAANVGLHALFLHDIVPEFNRAINGPFWTLAVEWQFYLALPFIALGISRLAVGASRSKARLIVGVLGFLVVALAVRVFVAFLNDHVLSGLSSHSTEYAAFDLGVRLLMGSQGKYLEVFAAGMLCSVLYIAYIERRVWPPRQTLILSVALLITAVIVCYTMAHVSFDDKGVALSPFYQFVHLDDWRSLFGPLVIGFGYAALVLGVLCGNRIIRAPFEFLPLRYIGLWSYSLYLWHLPVIQGVLPGGSDVPLWVRVPIAFLVSYASYQFIERPVMVYRKRSTGAPQSTTGRPPSATPGNRVALSMSTRSTTDA